MQDINTVTLKDLARDCKSIGDIQKKLKSIFKDTIEVALEAELDESLGYEKHDPRGNYSGRLPPRFIANVLLSRALVAPQQSPTP